MLIIKNFDQLPKKRIDQTPYLTENFDQLKMSSEIRSTDPLSHVTVNLNKSQKPNISIVLDQRFSTWGTQAVFREYVKFEIYSKLAIPDVYITKNDKAVHKRLKSAFDKPILDVTCLISTSIWVCKGRTAILFGGTQGS
jgi:hypothetical protein